MMRLLLSLVSFVLLGAVALAAPPGSGYHLLKKIPLGAAPGGGEYFDYVTVDSAARRVYLRRLLLHPDRRENSLE